MSITLWQYQLDQAARLTDAALEGIRTRADWERQRAVVRGDFFKCMGLDPLPPRCDLAVSDFGEFKGDGYSGRRLSYQVLPDCWNTCTLYLPAPLPDAPCPGVLYVCGHHVIGTLSYQQHAQMWARRGYACLIVDTTEQHDGVLTHHGTYYGCRKDWLSLGYTAAGGELWNGMRALDLLAARPEVDPARIGVTGISGGGAQSFYLAVADERLCAVATSCGVTLLKHTLRGRHLEEHCDCMYFHNPRRRVTSEFAALVAPRALLICSARHDSLFSDGEHAEIHDKARRIFALLGCEEKCGLFRYDGPHGYQPESIEAINKWFDRHVAGESRPLLPIGREEHGEAVITVYNGKPPAGQRMDLLPELLCRPGGVELPRTAADWAPGRERLVRLLRRELFPRPDIEPPRLNLDCVREHRANGGGAAPWRIDYRGALDRVEIMVRMFPARAPGSSVVVALTEPGEALVEAQRRIQALVAEHTLVLVEPRGHGLSAPHPDSEWNLLRAAALTGMMPVNRLLEDLAALLPVIMSWDEVRDRRLFLVGRGDAGVACLYQAALDTRIAGVIADAIPNSHRNGAYLLGILRHLDIDHVAGLAAPRPIGLVNQQAPCSNWSSRLYQRVGCPQRLVRGTDLKGVLDRVLGEKG